MSNENFTRGNIRHLLTSECIRQIRGVMLAFADNGVTSGHFVVKNGHLLQEIYVDGSGGMRLDFPAPSGRPWTEDRRVTFNSLSHFLGHAYA